ncbi:hypothetical protein LINPERHAP2_LOCUS23125 [Linum perenne]
MVSNLIENDEESNNKRLQIMTDLQKFPGLTLHQVIDVASALYRNENHQDLEFFYMLDTMEDKLYFILVMLRKWYEFLDNKYPDALDTKCQATADRVMKYAVAYYQTYCGADQLNEYQWYNMDDVLQRRGTNECGIYLLNLVEAWEGQVEDYMVNQWKLVEYCNKRRDSIYLKLLTYIITNWWMM